jgi:hypothetical protein
MKPTPSPPSVDIMLGGDPRALVRALGAIAVGGAAGETLPNPLGNSGALTGRELLHSYTDGYLIPLDWPAIERAHNAAIEDRWRDVIALDRELGADPRLKAIAAVSRFLGCQQLRRMRPVRGIRTPRRYLEAIEAGDADGWHLVVCGVVLATYNMPLRQGLLSYARQTYTGLLLGSEPRETEEARRAGWVEEALVGAVPRMQVAWHPAS